MYRILILILSVSFIISACGTPKELSTENIPTVDNLEIEKYLGKWYEIARLDHPFERDQENVTANYSLREDGEIRVLNRGYDTTDNEWSDAEGNAYRPDPENKPGLFKVSFFLFFYGDYKVIALDEDYQWVMVTSSSKEYLWILGREPQLSDEDYNMLIEKAEKWDFPLDDLYRLQHPERQ